jgi:pyruvate, water dikinase
MGKFRDLFFKGESCQLLVNLKGEHVQKYQSFKSLLEHNQASLSLMAEMEEIYYNGRPFNLVEVRKKVQEMATELKALLVDFDKLSGSKFPLLFEVFQRLQQELARELSPRITHASPELVLPLEALTSEKRNLVGAKAGNLSSIKNDLNLPVPEGFAVTAVAYDKFLEENDLFRIIETELSLFDPNSFKEMEKISTVLENEILAAKIPEDIQEAILGAYVSLTERLGKGLRISMRSSAFGEDTEASFAGQFKTVLNVTRENIMRAYKTVLASKYSPRALLYRYHRGFIDRLIPMGVAGIQMVDAKASGVIYTREPEYPELPLVKINSIWGLGEPLVDGSTSSDQFWVDRNEMLVKKIELSKKDQRLINLPQGGTILEEIPEMEKERPSLSDGQIIQLAKYGLTLEDYFGSPQDIEWALDQEDRLFILQSRPLNLPTRKPEQQDIRKEFSEHPILLSRGQTASPGIAVGPVYILRADGGNGAIPQGSILVAETASPNYAKLMGRINGIITDIGSITCHLASVAREFGVPAFFDAEKATSVLTPGEQVTLYSDITTVYQGIVKELADKARLPKNRIFETPVHQRLRTILDLISPLNLLDPQDPSFSPQGCRTVHDLIRFTHEQAVKEMFGLSASPDEHIAVRLKAGIPLIINLIDLGGGLQAGLSSCDMVTPEHIESLPLKSLWKGFTHPGITWAGTVQFDPKSFLSLMASSATSEFGEVPGGESYALISGDYLNLSAKFGYHFSTVDAFLGGQSSQNYIALQFSGGAGNFYGRSLRLFFLEEALKRLGFEVTVQGDLLEASVSGYAAQSLGEKLDQLGRLLASTRLLDMALQKPEDVGHLTRMFFEGDYDFLGHSSTPKILGFYVQQGHWEEVEKQGEKILSQDGSKAGYALSSGVAKVMGMVVGSDLQEFFDNVGAYYYFPLIIAKDSEMTEGTVRAKVKTVGGHIDRAGGIVFGLRSLGNYFVWRLNALEDNVVLFEYLNHKRFQRVSVNRKIESDRWYGLTVEVEGRMIRGYLDEEQVLTYETSGLLKGHAGLWTKADSVTWFRNFNVQRTGRESPSVNPA